MKNCEHTIGIYHDADGSKPLLIDQPIECSNKALSDGALELYNFCPVCGKELFCVTNMQRLENDEVEYTFKEAFVDNADN